ncbi:MAG: hypothetical protein ACJATA_000979 [Sphingobacteriales bacterium]
MLTLSNSAINIALNEFPNTGDACDSYTTFEFHQPSVNTTVKPGSELTIKWSLYRNDAQNDVADFYEIIIYYVGLDENGYIPSNPLANPIRNKRYGESDPDGLSNGYHLDREYNFDVPCDSLGIYLIEVRGSDPELTGRDHCTIYTWVRTEPLVPIINVAPQIQTVCGEGNYRMYFDNPSSADGLFIYDAEIGGAGDKIECEQDGMLIYDWSIGSSQVYNKYATFFWDQPNCGNVKESPIRIPIALLNIQGLVSAFTLDFSDLLNFDIDMQEIKDIPNQSCKTRTSPLLTGDYAALELQTRKLKDIQDDIRANLDSTAPGFNFSNFNVTSEWISETGVSGEYITEESLGTDARVCFSDLHAFKPEKGSCVDYSFYINFEGTIRPKEAAPQFKDVQESKVDCSIKTQIETTVCKEIEAPPSQVVFVCNKLDQVEIPVNGYDDAIWETHVNNLFITNGFINKNPLNGVPKGFNYEDFQNRKDRYNITVKYKALNNGRVGPKGLIQIVTLPDPMEIIQGFDDFDDITVYLDEPKTTENGCTEPRSYYDLSYELLFNAYDSLLGIIPEIDDDLNLVNFSIDIKPVWEPYQFYHHDYEDPTFNTVSDRVCWSDLPPTNLGHRRYTSYFDFNMTVEIKEEYKDRFTQDFYFENCELPGYDVNVFKNPLFKLDSISCNDYLDNTGLTLVDLIGSCDVSEVVYLCDTGGNVEIGTVVDSNVVTAAYQWNTTAGFLSGGENSQKAEIDYNSVPINDGEFKKYVQEVNGQGDWPFTHIRDVPYTYCALVFKCETCPVSLGTLKKATDIGQIKEEAIFQIYPNPANQELNVNWKGEKDNNLNIAIYNALGNLALFEALNNNFQKTNISHLPSGLYQIKLQDADEMTVASEKIIIIK